MLQFLNQKSTSKWTLHDWTKSLGTRFSSFFHSISIRASEKATLIGAMTSHGPPTHNIAQRSKSVNFTQRKNTPSHHVIFKYRTKSALVLEKVLKEDEAGIFEEINGEDVTPLASSSAKAAGKRKAKTEVGGNAVVIFDDDEDVKPIIKKPRSSAGSSEDQAIDLTAF